MDNLPTESPYYKWYILILAALTHAFVVAAPSMCMPVLFEEISEELGLSLVEIGAVWGMSSLTGIFTSLIGGSIGDRYGTKRTLAVTGVLAGITCALRGLSTDFITLSATILLYGFLTPAIPMNVHKVCGLWFSKPRLGLANGVVSAGMALGSAIGSMISATLLSPWLGGWRNVMLFYGVISIVISIPWALSRTAPGEHNSTPGQAHSVSMRQALVDVMRIKNVWSLGLVILGVGGCIQGVLGYLPLYLRKIGWSVTDADGSLAVFHGLSLLATIPITMLSDRLRSRKGILVVAAVMTVIGVGMLSIANGPAIWVAVVMTGIFRDGFMAVFMTMIIELRGVGAAYAGTATGLAMIFSRLGGLIAPPLGNSLAESHLSAPFALWAAMAAAALLGFYFVQEDRRPAVKPACST
ncbi:MAG: MFS transporter [Anaerolineae bacterium]|nr:MFS transporter [Anaerolineae bacterium]